MKLWELRRQALEARSHSAERRSELDEQRSAVRVADEKFMNCLREQGNEKFSAALCEEAFQELQAARNKYGPMEDDLRELEEDLSKLEFKIQKREARKYGSSQDDISGSGNDDDSANELETSSDSESNSSTLEDENVYHPLEREFLSRVGDLDLSYEAMRELVTDRRQILLDKAQRERVGMTLGPDDEATLSEYGERTAKVLQEIKETVADAKLLKKKCIDKGLYAGWDADDASMRMIREDDVTLGMLEDMARRF